MESEWSYQRIYEMVLDKMIEQGENIPSVNGGYNYRVGDIVSPLGLFVPLDLFENPDEDGEYVFKVDHRLLWERPGMEGVKPFHILIEILERAYLDVDNYIAWMIEFAEDWNEQWYGWRATADYIHVPDRARNFLIL